MNFPIDQDPRGTKGLEFSLRLLWEWEVWRPWRTVSGPLPSDGFPCSHGGGSAVQCSTSGFQEGKYSSMLGRVLGWALRGPEKKKSYNERARNQLELCHPWHASWHDTSSREVLDTKLVYGSRSEAANERRRTNRRGHGNGSAGPALREAAECWQGNFGILFNSLSAVFF